MTELYAEILGYETDPIDGTLTTTVAFSGEHGARTCVPRGCYKVTLTPLEPYNFFVTGLRQRATNEQGDKDEVSND